MTKIAPKVMQKVLSFEDTELGMCWVSNNPPPSLSSVDITSEGIHQSNEQETMIAHVVRAIRSAREVICVSTFIFQRTRITDELLKAAQRGIRVYMLTASENRLEKETDDMSEFDRKVIAEHKELLNEFAANILVRTAGHFHSKFILIDPTISAPKGFLFTANLTVRALTKNI